MSRRLLLKWQAPLSPQLKGQRHASHEGQPGLAALYAARLAGPVISAVRRTHQQYVSSQMAGASGHKLILLTSSILALCRRAPSLSHQSESMGGAGLEKHIITWKQFTMFLRSFITHLSLGKQQHPGSTDQKGTPCTQGPRLSLQIFGRCLMLSQHSNCPSETT